MVTPLCSNEAAYLDTQALSRFFSLPLEIRRQVYTSLFSSLTLSYPHFISSLNSTSRQIRDEALPLFYRHVQFDVGSTEHFVDFLSSIDRSTITQLRHLSVKGSPFPLYSPKDRSCYHTHYFTSLLSLFPGLQLSTLSVEDPYHGEDVHEDGWGHDATYNHVGKLVESKGFKELIFTSASDRFLEPVDFQGSNGPMHHGRQPQPSTWDRMIKERDGASSGAGVEMCEVSPAGRIKLGVVYRNADSPAPDDRDQDYGDYLAYESDEEENDDDEKVAIEVRIRRGRDADYVQDGKMLSEFDHRLHETFAQMSWKDIKEQGLFIPGAERDPTSHL